MSMANYISCVANGVQVAPSIFDGIDAMSVMEAARESDKNASAITPVIYLT
jgi:hypothetical protein